MAAESAVHSSLARRFSDAKGSDLLGGPDSAGMYDLTSTSPTPGTPLSSPYAELGATLRLASSSPPPDPTQPLWIEPRDGARSAPPVVDQASSPYDRPEGRPGSAPPPPLQHSGHDRDLTSLSNNGDKEVTGSTKRKSSMSRHGAIGSPAPLRNRYHNEQQQHSPSLSIVGEAGSSPAKLYGLSPASGSHVKVPHQSGQLQNLRSSSGMLLDVPEGEEVPDHDARVTPPPNILGFGHSSFGTSTPPPPGLASTLGSPGQRTPQGVGVGGMHQHQYGGGDEVPALLHPGAVRAFNPIDRPSTAPPTLDPMLATPAGLGSGLQTPDIRCDENYSEFFSMYQEENTHLPPPLEPVPDLVRARARARPAQDSLEMDSPGERDATQFASSLGYASATGSFADPHAPPSSSSAYAPRSPSPPWDACAASHPTACGAHATLTTAQQLGLPAPVPAPATVLSAQMAAHNSVHQLPLAMSVPQQPQIGLGAGLAAPTLGQTIPPLPRATAGLGATMPPPPNELLATAAGCTSASMAAAAGLRQSPLLGVTGYPTPAYADGTPGIPPFPPWSLGPGAGGAPPGVLPGAGPLQTPLAGHMLPPDQQSKNHVNSLEDGSASSAQARSKAKPKKGATTGVVNARLAPPPQPVMPLSSGCTSSACSGAPRDVRPATTLVNNQKPATGFLSSGPGGVLDNSKPCAAMNGAVINDKSALSTAQSARASGGGGGGGGGAGGGGASGGGGSGNRGGFKAAQLDELFATNAFVNNVLSIARDQAGCRLLQQKLDEGNLEINNLIFVEVISNCEELMMDPFGNYLCQKLMEMCNVQQLERILEKVAGELVHVCMDMHGARAVQKLVDTVSGTPLVPRLVAALDGSVVLLTKDPNGNHVVQRCLESLPPEAHGFIFRAIVTEILDASTHRQGCRIVQRCIEAAVGQNRQLLIASICHNTLLLVQDPFGNYVVQYVLSLNDEHACALIVQRIGGCLNNLSRQKFSSNVVERCLQLCGPQEREQMLMELCSLGSIVGELLRDVYGNYVIQSALSIASEPHLSVLLSLIRPVLPSMRMNNQGRRIAQKLEKKYPQLRQGPDAAVGASVGLDGRPGP
eukprot:CAMPEP_0178428648 /NCGR_PEP_ID=MMETSP0689_2-20121128/30388_1 /TAXON_ID=160604 /ORGANISM="Amphidinium massartii, Strain CS-259" /LENGTH=1091 /DNA_ID=CAMNT_0020050431 /DNA_START=229 /DNA_END=3500 /DNA_ORIENTATION=-